MSDEHEPVANDDLDDVSAWNLAIIEALADGVHPMTGKSLAETSIFHDGKVRRALGAARDALAREGQRRARQATLPKKAGRPWSAEEDAALIERFEGGAGMADLSAQHSRTEGAIRARLMKLGKLLPEH